MELVVLTDVPPSLDWERAHQVAARLPRALGTERSGLVVWLATPTALRQARELRPDVLVYDVEGYLPGYQDALEAADLVFTGGRSLQRAITTFRPDAHCFASGVDAAHFAAAAVARRPRHRRVAGYAGTVDDRLDVDLLRHVAECLPEWDVRVVEPSSYAELPAVLAEFDVGLLPFVLDERTPSLSPTKTLEYLAAGIPVVATRMPDVADAFSDVVALEEGALGFAAACMRVVGDDAGSRADRAKPLLKWHDWDTVVARMAKVITERSRQGAELAV